MKPEFQLLAFRSRPSGSPSRSASWPARAHCTPVAGDGKADRLAYEITFAALIGGIVGARGYYLIEKAGSLHGSLVATSSRARAGLVRRRDRRRNRSDRLDAMGGVLEWRMLDMCATALTLGYAIGRIGCQFGRWRLRIRSTLPTSMAIRTATVPTPPGVTVLPTPIYETVLMCLLAYGLLAPARSRPAGRDFAL